MQKRIVVRLKCISIYFIFISNNIYVYMECVIAYFNIFYIHIKHDDFDTFLGGDIDFNIFYIHIKPEAKKDAAIRDAFQYILYSYQTKLSS